MIPPGWAYGDIGVGVESLAPDVGECVSCGNVGQICCGDYEEAPDGLLESVDGTCRDCCAPHPKRMAGVGYYERMDCDV